MKDKAACRPGPHFGRCRLKPTKAATAASPSVSSVTSRSHVAFATTMIKARPAKHARTAHGGLSHAVPSRRPSLPCRPLDPSGRAPAENLVGDLGVDHQVENTKWFALPC